jgi:hypothetical protein
MTHEIANLERYSGHSEVAVAISDAWDKREGITVESLVKELDQRGIPKSKYAINDPDSDNKYNLHMEGTLWTVYWSERGNRYDGAFFVVFRHAADFLGYLLGKQHIFD